MPPAVQGPVEVNIGGTVFTTLRPTLADASPFFKELLDETDGPRAVGVERRRVARHAASALSPPVTGYERG